MSILIRQSKIEQDQFRRMIGSHDQSFFCRNRRLGQIPVGLECDLQQFSDLRLIIYDQYLCLIHSSKTFMNEVLTGMDITKREPDEFDFSSSTLPPNASVNPLTMERPRPDPFDFTLADRENLSNTRWKSVDLNPWPSSSMIIFSKST